MKLTAESRDVVLSFDVELGCVLVCGWGCWYSLLVAAGVSVSIVNAAKDELLPCLIFHEGKTFKPKTLILMQAH